MSSALPVLLRLTSEIASAAYNAAGQVTGRASSQAINLSVVGGGLTASMSVATKGSSQTVAISTEGSGLKSVNIELSRG